MSRRVPRGQLGPDEEPQVYQDRRYQDQQYADQRHADPRYQEQRFADPRYQGQQYGDQWQTDPRYQDQRPTDPRYQGQQYGNQRPTDPRYQDQQYQDQQYQNRRYQDQQNQRYEPRQPGPGDPAYGLPPLRRPRFRRTRRMFRRRSVRVVSALVALCLVWLMFSVGQAAFKNNGQSLSANLAEWARDHYLGPVVTFGEWVSYKPPPKGGKPAFSYTVPSGEAVTPVKTGAGKSKAAFVPDIPATLVSLAGTSIPGEGQWRVVEKVKGEPAILATFLRDATYTSQSNGIASIDQRLVKFSLRPGTEDPGPNNWGVSNYIPAGQRTGLLATFNGGFKLDSAGGGFYLNGIYHGTLNDGVASIVYYKDGTIKIGEWGRDFKMTSSVAGVRQNLKLLVDHGKVSADANVAVGTNWGATLGGGEYVWRSGLGITKDGRVVYVYGSALNAQDLGELLQRAGAVEGMQMDINPAWMKFDYYQAGSHPSDPTPVPLLPTQQPSPYSYYTPSTRDFTAVYAR
jgi:hypothetical protein